MADGPTEEEGLGGFGGSGGGPSRPLEEVVGRIRPPDREIMQAARQRANRLVKPVGSLGKLEEYYVRLAGTARTLDPDVARKAVVVMAADHGIFEEGVAATARPVTLAQAINMTRGVTGICALAKQAGAEVVVVDVGIDADVDCPDIVHRKIARGTRNFAKGPAMTREQAIRSVEVGIEVATRKIEEGVRLLGVGEMGIGNTTPSSAIVAVFARCCPSEVTGPGANLPADRIGRKVEVVRRGIEVNRPDRSDGIDVLAKVGGLEIGGMAGVMVGGASRGVPVVVDGFVASAAALIACALAPRVRDYLFPSHSSAEPGARVAAELLQFDPPLALDMRLGEGTGAAMMFNVLEAAVFMSRHMITFDEAGFVAP